MNLDFIHLVLCLFYFFPFFSFFFISCFSTFFLLFFSSFLFFSLPWWPRIARYRETISAVPP